ncbi:hypothetical protein [Flavobacterium sp. 3HN19-14]|uniref:hypothetical protein n=1 Tax=Flavobacterium sp. 3HN19-14 TaxID=3448133 RepID=UPI003EE23ECC
MKKFIQKIAIVTALMMLFSACQDDDHTFGDINTPNGLEVHAVLQGEDGSNPNGDGSGIVSFTATANNALSYKYIFSDGNTLSLQTEKLRKGLLSTALTLIP